MAQVKQQTTLETRMADLDAKRAEVKHQLDRERLVKITGSVIETITSPEFIERMRVVREKAANGDGLEEVGKMLTLEGLRKAGADIPDDFRLTSRVFEDRVNGLRFEVTPKLDGISPIDPLGWGACAGGGAATVCGCGGFST